VLSKAGASAINLQSLRIEFAKACTCYAYSLHRDRPLCSDTTEGATMIFSLFPYHKVCSNSTKHSSGLHGKTRENTQTARSNAVQTSFCVENVNLFLASKETKLHQKILTSIEYCYWEVTG
jgi:hypothetical protein